MTRIFIRFAGSTYALYVDDKYDVLSAIAKLVDVSLFKFKIMQLSTFTLNKFDCSSLELEKYMTYEAPLCVIVLPNGFEERVFDGKIGCTIRSARLKSLILNYPMLENHLDEIPMASNYRHEYTFIDGVRERSYTGNIGDFVASTTKLCDHMKIVNLESECQILVNPCWFYQ